jgi:hypothetical protein
LTLTEPASYRFTLANRNQPGEKQVKRILALAAITVLICATASRLLAQNPAAATWKLNVAKSKYIPGPPPKSMTRTVESQGDKVKYTFSGVNADGSAISYSFTVAYDGKDYPITGAAPGGADTISITKSSSGSNEAILKKSGHPVLISKVKLSDGKVTTITQTSPQGTGPVNNTLVYEKQ